jgi:hypothetical protein
VGIIKAIVALLRAVPSLERLFLSIADGVKEANAKVRYEEKLDNIDSAVDAHRMSGGKIEWSEGVDRSPPVSDSSEGSTSFHEGSVEKSS